MDVSAALSSIAQALTVVKAIKDVDSAFDRATYKMQIADLMSSLADVKMSVLAARDEIHEKDAELKRLREDFTRQAELVLGPGDYKYRVDKNGFKIGYPMCRHCEHEGRTVQLVQNRHFHKSICPRCRTEFEPVECFLPPSPDGTQTTVLEDQRDQLERRRKIVGRIAPRRDWIDY